MTPGDRLKITRAFIDKCQERKFQVNKTIELWKCIPRMSTRDMIMINRYFNDMNHVVYLRAWFQEVDTDAEPGGKDWENKIGQLQRRIAITQWHELQMYKAGVEDDRNALDYMLDKSQSNVEFRNAWNDIFFKQFTDFCVQNKIEQLCIGDEIEFDEKRLVIRLIRHNSGEKLTSKETFHIFREYCRIQQLSIASLKRRINVFH